jgi:hypothetical protein
VSHNDDDIPYTLFCPLCGAPPAVASLNLTPWFCSNDDCDVLAWDPYSTLQENLMNAAPVEIVTNKEIPPEMPKQ